MAITNFDKFNGIASYHDGDVIADYENVIPIGDLIIDRVGEKRVTQPKDAEPRGTYVDSIGNIYTVYGDEVYMTREGDTGVFSNNRMLMRNGDDIINSKLLTSVGRVTFCESSVKPSTVYMCDGAYIYQWNTYSVDQDVAYEKPYMIQYLIRMMPSPDFIPNLSYSEDISELHDIDQYAILSENGDVNYKNLYSKYFDVVKVEPITSISWFNNKLVATQQGKNTVWLTSTDPQQYFRYMLSDGSYRTNLLGKTLPNRSMWKVSSGTITSNLWNYWCSSTNSADRLNEAIAFNGQLFLLNNGSIEMWSATGIEDAPIQQNSMNTMYHGARCPLIISNVMYLVCKDKLGNEYIGCIVDGSFKRLSNSEIEKRINNKIKDIVPLIVRNVPNVVVRLIDDNSSNTVISYVVTESGLWWKRTNNKFSEHSEWSIVDNYAITNKGGVIEFDEHSRLLVDGTPIMRKIVDFFTLFEGRKIINCIESVMDTGVMFGAPSDEIKPNRIVNDNDIVNRSVWIRLSTDKGHTFGKFLYRSLSKRGRNDSIVEWPALGSANNLLLEIGTSANYRFQIYKIRLQTM